MLPRETIAVIVKVVGNIRNILYGHSAESLNVKAGGSRRNHRV